MFSMYQTRLAGTTAGQLCPGSIMRRIGRLSLGFVGCVSIAGHAQSPAPPSAIVQPTTIDFPGSSSTRAYGINKAGDIVGTYVVSSPVGVNSHGFLLAGGRFTAVDFPGSFGTEAYGINAAGEIVGVYWDNQGAAFGRHGFLLSGGRFTRIDGPHAVVTRALGINDGGQIVGVYTVRGPSGIPGSEAGGLLFRLLGHPYPYAYEYGHGFVYANGRFTNVDFPGAAHGEQTLASAINAAGKVVGTYLDRNYVTHGFMLTKGNFINLDVPGSRETFATGINMAGQVVGHFSYPAGYGPGFLWSEGRATVIDFTHVVPGVSVVTVPCDINDAGQIVGWYGAGDAKYYVPGGPATPYHEHGFMLSPDR
jgi:probable HAF family extracellular repeat protein